MRHAHRKLLVANRGEIARRMMRTCRSMGIWDGRGLCGRRCDAPHVRSRTRRCGSGWRCVAESYLDVGCISRGEADRRRLRCIRAMGFSRENRRLRAGGDRRGPHFVGPSPDAIRAMGGKREAKRGRCDGGRACSSPASMAAHQSTAHAGAEAREIGLPGLVKPSAGGGGKGMRIARAPASLQEAIESGAPRGAERLRRSARCSSSGTSSVRGMSRFRSSVTSTGNSCTSSSASAPSSGGTRRWSRRRLRRRSTPSCAGAWARRRSRRGAGHRLHQRGHRRVPAGRRRRVLFPPR